MSGIEYRGMKRREVRFPLGGVGSGCVSLCGDGRLRDWEIFNRPNKGTYNGFSHFAVKVEPEGGTPVVRVLHSDPIYPDYIASGRGMQRAEIAGLPHMADTVFTGQFPQAAVDYVQPDLPVSVRLVALSPFIPLNPRDSSIPAAMFVFQLRNSSTQTLRVSVAASVSNPHYEGFVVKAESNKFLVLDDEPFFALGSENLPFDGKHGTGVTLRSSLYDSDSPRFGDLTVATNAVNAARQVYWYRGGHRFESLKTYWKDLCAPGDLPERNYGSPATSSMHHGVDTATVVASAVLSPGDSTELPFVLTWSFPNYTKYWTGGDGNGTWKNHYAVEWRDSTESADYVLGHFDRLRKETKQFADALWSSSLPNAAMDAVASNLSTLRTPTVARLTDGTFYGWEGCLPQDGSCEGSCTHVWNYAIAPAFLFPSLASSMVEAHLRYNQDPSGLIHSRMQLPLGEPGKGNHTQVDGHMGTIFNVYRQWRITGDEKWMASLWPNVKQAVAFAWSAENADGWDRDKDGVLEGRQAHTLDTGLHGPSAYLTGYYLLALAAASDMADAVGDPVAAEYRELFSKGRRWINSEVFNGEYYAHQVDLRDPDLPLNPETGELDYQIANGCHTDQVLAQWYADAVGAGPEGDGIGKLGSIFDPEKRRRALNSLVRYNFKESLRDYVNTFRVFALDDEPGLVMCTWPNGDEPQVPVRFAEECMTGFEYPVAASLIRTGAIEDGLRIVTAIRGRYDGEKRNPYNEIECGSHYSRALSAYDLLHAFSGFGFDVRTGHLEFSPVEIPSAGEAGPPNGKSSFFFCVGKAWGMVIRESTTLTIRIVYGTLSLRTLSLGGTYAGTIQAIRTKDAAIGFQSRNGYVELEQDVVLNAGDALRIVIESA